jgi:signal transduction histidine kinase
MTTAVPSLLLRGLSRSQLLMFDAVLAVALAVLGGVAATEAPLAPHPSWHEPGWLSLLAGVLLAAPVAFRRVWPEAAAWSAIALAALIVGSGVIPDYAGVAPTVVLGFVLYTAGVEVGRRRSVWIVIAGILVLAVAFGWSSRQPFEVGLVLWVLGACWAIGRTIRERRAHAVRSATQATELALGEERLRIARDLHDIVAHNMSLIAVRATVADHIADAHPQEMRESLQVIAATSRDTLIELRRALGVLRAEAITLPAPGLGDLGGLVTSARSAGLDVDLQVHGDQTVPEGIGVAVFRVVQEALTNVLKHARATACRVDVAVEPGEVRLEVSDNGAGGPHAGSMGQGLIGMRERAALCGGELVAGPGPEGGWVVRTTLRFLS